MLNTLFVLFGRIRLFWQLRGRTQRLAFLVRRSLFGAKSRFLEGRIRTNTFLRLGVSTLGTLLAAISFSAALQIINPFFDPFFEQVELRFESEPYSTLLATIAATGGVLIGLYYTATTTIAGAIYSKVPNDVRELLARDRVGNVYIRFLAFLTYVSVVLLAMKAAGFAPNRLGAFLLLIGAGISIVAFARLGARAFDLFDPTSLARELTYQVSRAYLRVTPREFRWQDPSFQNHAYRTARSSLDTVRTVAAITEEAPHLSGRPFVSLCTQLLGLLVNYEVVRKTIPTDSRWYPRQYSYPDWYQTEDSTTTLAYQTASRLNPKEVSDTDWLETEILPIVHSCFRTNIHHHELASQLTQYFGAYLQILSQEHNVEGALKALDSFVAKNVELFFPIFSEPERQESVEQIALVDAIASLPTAILLAYRQSVELAGRDTIGATVRRMQWRSSREIYQSGFVRCLMPKLEYLFPRIEFERRTEGLKISPDWYLVEIVSQASAENFSQALVGLTRTVQSLFERWIETASAKKLHWIKAILLSREIEYWSKFERSFDELRNHWSMLSDDRRIEGLFWPTVDFSAAENIQSERHKALIGLMAEDLPGLTARPRPPSYPDFAGQFLHVLAEKLLSALISNEPDTVALVFPQFFVSSLLQYERIRGKADSNDWRAEIQTRIAVAPILDLMSLSGYGFVFAELHKNPALSKVIRDSWNNYLNKREAEGANLLQFLDAAASLQNSIFGIGQRSIIRTQWKLTVAQELRKLPRTPIAEQGPFSGMRTSVDHESPLVRVMAGDGDLGSFYDGVDVFMYEVLSRRPNARLRGNHRDMARAIARESGQKQ